MRQQRKEENIVERKRGAKVAREEKTNSMTKSKVEKADAIKKA